MGAADPPPHTATGRAMCHLQENQGIIASWEILRALLSTKSETCGPGMVQSSPAALGQDTTVAPGWWLEPDASQHMHHPALPACPHHAHQDTCLALLWLLGLHLWQQKSSTTCPLHWELEGHKAI